MGSLLFKNGVIEPAIDNLQKSFSLKNENPKCVQKLAEAYIMHGEDLDEEALYFAKESLAINPKNYNILIGD